MAKKNYTASPVEEATETFGELEQGVPVAEVVAPVPELTLDPQMVEALESDDDLGPILDEAEEDAAAPAAPAAPVAVPEGMVSIVASADLRVVTPRDLTVFHLTKDVPRVLSATLGMAAQMQGGLSGVRVTITDV